MMTLVAFVPCFTHDLCIAVVFEGAAGTFGGASGAAGAAGAEAATLA